MCNIAGVTHSNKGKTNSEPNYDHCQQYLHIINQHTNDKIISLIDEFNKANIDESTLTPKFRLTFVDKVEDVLYELCEYFFLEF